MSSTQTVQISDLDDVLELVKDIFYRLGDSTTIQIGGKFEDTPGGYPRVLFLPEITGEMGPPTEAGGDCCSSWTHRCGVAVRAQEPGSDVSRLKPAYELAALVIAVLRNLDHQHIRMTPGRPKDTSPLRQGGYGGQVSFEFAYQTDIATPPAVLRAITELIAVSPRDPLRPEGDTGNMFDVRLTVSAERS